MSKSKKPPAPYKLCRACKAWVRFDTSRNDVTHMLNPDGSVHMCQEYLDNLRKKVKGYFRPANWAYDPATPAEWALGLHYLESYYVNN